MKVGGRRILEDIYVSSGFTKDMMRSKIKSAYVLDSIVIF